MTAPLSSLLARIHGNDDNHGCLCPMSRTPRDWTSLACRLILDDHVVLLDRHGHRLGDIRPRDATIGPCLNAVRLASVRRGELTARKDAHVVGAGGHVAAAGAHERLAGGEVVLPAVPGAREQRRAGVHVHIARAAGDRALCERPKAQRTELVGAPVAERVELVADAEDSDGLAVHVDDLPIAVLEVGHLADDDPHALTCSNGPGRAGAVRRLPVIAADDICLMISNSWL